MGLTLSAAFKKAWELIKGKAIESKVAGVTKGNRQKALHRILTHYTPNQVRVWLERDKANLHDNNAVAVMISVNNSIVVQNRLYSEEFSLCHIGNSRQRLLALKPPLKRLEGITPVL